MKFKSGAVPTFAWPLLIFIAAGVILMLSVEPPQPSSIEAPLPPQLFSSSYQLLATGNRLGTYYPAGHILAEWLNSNLSAGEEVFKAVETNGSVDNVRLLQEGKVMLGLAESRIVKEAFTASPSCGLRLVWPLWPDVVHLIVAPGLASSSLPELDAGFFGQQNSSTARTSREIFSTLQLKPTGVMAQPERVVNDLISGRLKFAMVQAGMPNRAVSDALIFHNCSLYNFAGEDYEKLLGNISTSWQVTLPTGYYGENQPELKTFGIPNVLVADEKTSSETIQLICDLLSRSSLALKIRHQAFADVPSDAGQARKILGEIGVPLHPGTIAWLAGKSQNASSGVELEND